MNSIFLKAFFFILLCTQGTFIRAATSSNLVCRNYFTYSDILKDLTPEENSILTQAARIYVQLNRHPHSEVTDQKRTLNLQLQKFQQRKKINNAQMTWLFDSFIKVELSRSAEVIQADMQKKAERDLLRNNQVASEKDNLNQLQRILKKYNTDDINIAFVKSSYPNEENQMQTEIQEVLFFIEKLKVDVNFQDEGGMSALMLASEHKQTDILKLLIQEKANVNLQNKIGSTALALASKIGNNTAISLLLQANADVNLPDKQKNTPLMRATLAKSESSVRLLLEAGAKVDFADHWGETPFIKAAINGDLDLLDLFLQKGANMNHQSLSGRTAMIRAADSRQSLVVEKLIQLGADVNLSTHNDQSTLSVSLYDPSTVKALILAGAKINHQDKDGHTAAMMAAMSESRLPSLLRLIEYNADLSLRTYLENKTALDYARESGVTPAIELIEKYNQRKSIP